MWYNVIAHICHEPRRRQKGFWLFEAVQASLPAGYFGVFGSVELVVMTLEGGHGRRGDVAEQTWPEQIR